MLHLLLFTYSVKAGGLIFPGKEWEFREPTEMGLDAEKLGKFAEMLGGRGCIIRNGAMVMTWGSQSEAGDWLSSAKPVLSTLLFFAIQEGRVKGVDQPVSDFGWELLPKDKTMTFFHLANMISGYARPEEPGRAWAYNDYAIQLYQKTLFDKVFGGDPTALALDPARLGSLGIQDTFYFTDDKRRLFASVRDFARIAWLWLNRGNWNGVRLLPEKYFERYMKAQVPPELLQTAKAETNDYLGIGTYGGDSDHFTEYGAGTYGFNWWFNEAGRLHPDSRAWPDAPEDAFMSIGAGGNCSIIIPSHRIVVACAKGNWGNIVFGNAESQTNRLFKILMDAVINDASIEGTPRVWHTVTLSFKGPVSSEDGNIPNPFLDYRLQVKFTGPGGIQYDVPGYFAGDGEENPEGNIWRIHFTPDRSGMWTYSISFRTGKEIAISLDEYGGKSAGFCDGTNGKIIVGERDKEAPGIIKWGRLEYTGEAYLKFRDGPYWIKGGIDSPENFLCYEEFDNTSAGKFGVHRYAAHVKEWRPGDATWNGEKGRGLGRGIIGAINYLSSRNVNSLYFLSMNIGGDGQDVWPYRGEVNPGGSPENDNLHFDISKLRQWEMIFAHAQKKGLNLLFVLDEGEKNNKLELDGGELGIERKLYYREMIARFAHHNALLWNLCEEYDINPYPWTPEHIQSFAEYIRAVDPYDHPVTVHNADIKAWEPFWGDGRFSVTSLQYYPRGGVSYGDKTEELRRTSRESGRMLPLFFDEPNRTIKTDDMSYVSEKWPYESGQSFQRKNVLWPIFLSGGGVEYILQDLLYTDDFNPYEMIWDYTWYARRFMEENLPFWEMEARDELLSGEAEGYFEDGQVFAKAGSVYAVYLPDARLGGTLNLAGAEGSFIKRWYNPRAGEFTGAVETVQGGRSISLGFPPGEYEEDWVVLLKANL